MTSRCRSDLGLGLGSKRWCVLLTAWFLCVAQTARADRLTIAASADTTIYKESSNSSGAGQYLFAGVTRNGLVRRALIAFDIAKALPQGTVLTEVALTLHVSRTGAGPSQVQLHRLRAAWGEGSSDANGRDGVGAKATEGDATWSERVYGEAAWQNPGGDFDADASAATMVDQTGDYTFSGASLVEDVQAWLDDPSHNFGWILTAEGVEGVSAKRFNSRQFLGPGRPTLTLTYETPAAPVGTCCDAQGECGIRHDAQGCAGAFGGLGTSCDPNPCPPPTGACCQRNAVATCELLSQDDCAESSGTWRGPGVACAPNNPCPPLLTPFVDPLPIPPLATPDGSVDGVDHYRISMVQNKQKLHSELPETTVWAYSDGHYTGYPGPTIQARVDTPVKVTWVNDLRDEHGALREHHLLPVDQCVHGAEQDAPRTVVHLHGAHVPAAYDGQPEQTILPGQETTYEYPNHQEAATLWYHDHAIGITRLNVYMGLAGLYLLRDPVEDALPLPPAEYEIPLLIQDRSFMADGRLVYPEKWEAHFFGDAPLVNGKVSPYLDVKRGMYRFRLLNGSGSRTYKFSLSKSLPMTVIGSDGGLLPKPVELTTVTLGPAERIEVVIDFSQHFPGEVVYLFNAADTPYPNGGLPHPIDRLLQFRVGTDEGYRAPLPEVLRPREDLPEAAAARSRDLVLNPMPDDCTGTAWLINGKMYDEITEHAVLGTSEIWRFFNPTQVMHPMHMHLVMFQVLDRQSIAQSVQGSQSEPKQASDHGEGHEQGPVQDMPVLIGDRRPPRPEESGWKDTVQVGPMEMVRVIARFTDYAGRFPYHCHILEHEDQAMMRQFETHAPGEAIDAGVPGAEESDASTDAPTGGQDQSQGQGGCGACALEARSRVGLGWLGGAVLCLTLRLRRRERRTGQ